MTIVNQKISRVTLTKVNRQLDYLNTITDPVGYYCCAGGTDGFTGIGCFLFGRACGQTTDFGTCVNGCFLTPASQSGCITCVSTTGFPGTNGIWRSLGSGNGATLFQKISDCCS